MPQRPPEFSLARTCYDHLAGVLGVWLHDRLAAAGAIEAATRDRADVVLTATLDDVLGGLGLEPAPPSRSRRAAYACRDLTERTHHLGGALGARLCTHALGSGWFVRIQGTRALRLTDLGVTELTRWLGPLPAEVLLPRN